MSRALSRAGDGTVRLQGTQRKVVENGGHGTHVCDGKL